MPGIEKRLHPRYESTDVPELKLYTVNGPIGEKLMTLSIGGCGFWAPMGDFRFEMGDRVRLTGQVEGCGDPLPEIRGEILYVHPHPIEGQIGRFYGIRFIAEQKNIGEFQNSLQLLLENKKKLAGGASG